MLVNADVKSLEVVVAAELSKDPVLCKEIVDREDIHENNRAAFKLPSRLIAKTFKFRLIYGGSAYSYAHDPDFMEVSKSKIYWQKVIDRYYEKYKGLGRWHNWLLDEVRRTGIVEIPSGRFYPFEPDRERGEPRWPVTKIKNYPVQGFGADLVMLARLEFNKLLRESGLEAVMISTIHDSIVVDTPSKNVYNIRDMLKTSIEAVPALCKRVWDYEFSLPLTCEIQAGPNKKDMKDI
jgi:DNA polymerase I-like protein with 3'-5' exonuclease and polymerase domains